MNKKGTFILFFLLTIVILTGFWIYHFKNHKDNTNSNTLQDINYPKLITDFNQKKITISKKPKTIVSLSPSITEILCELGLENQIIGISEETKYPLKITNKTKVGNYADIDVELIKSLKPDIVFASKYVYQNTANDLYSQGICVLYIEPNSYNAMFDTIDLISEIFDIKQNGKKLSQRIKTQVEEAVDINNLQESNILYVQSIEPLYVAGDKTLVNDIILLLGGKNTAWDVLGYSEFNGNRLAERKIDVIILSNKLNQKDTVDYLKTHKLFKNLDAVKDNKILVLPDEYLYVNPTPRISKAIHPIVSYIKE